MENKEYSLTELKEKATDFLNRKRNRNETTYINYRTSINYFIYYLTDVAEVEVLGTDNLFAGETEPSTTEESIEEVVAKSEEKEETEETVVEKDEEKAVEKSEEKVEKTSKAKKPEKAEKKSTVKDEEVQE